MVFYTVSMALLKFPYPVALGVVGCRSLKTVDDFRVRGSVHCPAARD